MNNQEYKTIKKDSLHCFMMAIAVVATLVILAPQNAKAQAQCTTHPAINIGSQTGPGLLPDAVGGHVREDDAGNSTALGTSSRSGSIVQGYSPNDLRADICAQLEEIGSWPLHGSATQEREHANDVMAALVRAGVAKQVRPGAIVFNGKLYSLPMRSVLREDLADVMSRSLDRGSYQINAGIDGPQAPNDYPACLNIPEGCRRFNADGDPITWQAMEFRSDNGEVPMFRLSRGKLSTFMRWSEASDVNDRGVDGRNILDRLVYANTFWLNLPRKAMDAGRQDIIDGFLDDVDYLLDQGATPSRWSMAMMNLHFRGKQGVGTEGYDRGRFNLIIRRMDARQELYAHRSR